MACCYHDTARELTCSSELVCRLIASARDALPHRRHKWLGRRMRAGVSAGFHIIPQHRDDGAQRRKKMRQRSVLQPSECCIAKRITQTRTHVHRGR